MPSPSAAVASGGEREKNAQGDAGGERKRDDRASGEEGECAGWRPVCALVLVLAASGCAAWSGFVSFRGKGVCVCFALVCVRGRAKARRAVLVASKRRARLVPPGVRRPDRCKPCEVAEWSLWF